MPAPKTDEVFAVHRETTTGGVNVPPGGLPPLVTLSLAPNKYLVTAKLLVMNMSNEPQQVSCTLRPMGTTGTPYDTSEVRLAPLSQAGEMHNLVLHCVIELTAAGGVGRLRPYGSGRRHKSGAHLADSAQYQLSDEDRADLSCVFGGEHIRWPC